MHRRALLRSFLLAAVAAASIAVPVLARGDVAWHDGADGYRRATEVARETGRPLFVYFYTDWCPYCRQLDRDLLSTPEVAAQLGSMVAVRVNPERGAAEQALAARFGIRGYPTLFVDGAGGTRAVRRTVADGGGQRLMTPSEFAATLAAAAR